MREFGVVSFNLGQSPAEVAAARPYMGVARTQLGITKNIMNLGGLQSHARTVRLNDGTLIYTQSVMGQDYVQIVPVVHSAPVRPIEQITVKNKKQREVFAEGWVRGPDGPAKNGHRAVWDPAGKRMLVFSGWDRALPSVEGQPNIPRTFDEDGNEIHPGQSEVIGGVVAYAQRSTLNSGTCPFWDAAGNYMGSQHDRDIPGMYLPPNGTSEMNKYDYARTFADARIEYNFHLTPNFGTGALAGAPHYHPASLGIHFYVCDLRYSNELWQFTIEGGWSRLADISENTWRALVADAVGYSGYDSIGPDSRSRFRQTTLKQYIHHATPDVVAPSRYGTTEVFSYEDNCYVVFGGTFNVSGQFNNSSSLGETWLFYDARMLVGYEDDPTP